MASDNIARYERLAQDRKTLDGHLDQVRELFYPVGLPFLGTDTLGAKVHEKVFDSTPEQAAELLAAGLQSMLTNPSVKWFSMRPVNYRLEEDEESNVWLEHAADRMYAVFNSPRSNFTPNQHEKYMDLSCYGTGCMYTADRAGDLPLFSARPLAECYLAENDEGKVDTLYRKFSMTARQAVDKWGKNAGDKALKAADDMKRQDDLCYYLHGVYPRPGGMMSAKNRRGLPFRSCWIALDDKALVDEGGFHEFPYTTPRWIKRAGEAYGRGPGMKALADARMLQRAMKITIRGVEKIIDPPLIVADDGVLSPIRATPSGINYARWDMMMAQGSPIRPLATGGKPDLGENFMATVRERIENAFYAPLFRFARDPNMTATQYLGISEQTMQILNPIVGRMQMEDLGPLIDRVFGIMLRAGLIDPPPPQLGGAELRVEYVSPVAKQQRLGEARAYAQLNEIFARDLAADPSLADNMNKDKAYRGTADLLGVRKDWLNPTDQVAAMRQGRNDAAAQQADLQSNAAQAEMFATGAKGIKSLSDAAANGDGTDQGAADAQGDANV